MAMRQAWVRFLLLNKRLFRKYSFLAVLCLVPVMMAAISFAAGRDTGMVTIALVAEDPSDSFHRNILNRILKYEGVVRYRIFDSREEAVECLRGNRVDAVWIFPGALEEKLAEASALKQMSPVVSVVQREDTVVLSFTREVLANALYPDFSYAVYRDYLDNHLGLAELPEEDKREAYYGILPEQNMFEMTYPGGERMEEGNYLLAPLRGLLAVWLLLCGLVSSLYYMQDEARGVFVRMRSKRKLNQAFAVQGILLADAVVFFLPSCRAAGIFTSWGRETLCAVLYASCILSFCNLWRLLLQRPERLCACIPVFVSGMLILNPIFVDISEFGIFRYLFPPIYYLQAIRNNEFLWGMALYAMGMYLLCAVLTSFERGTPRGAEPGRRIVWADLARGIAIFLVALGHSVLVDEAFKYWIYTFHMPLFFFVSGYFLIREGDSLGERIRKKAASVFPLYFLASAGGFLLESLLGGNIKWNALIGIFVCQYGKYDGYLWFFPALFGLQCLLLILWNRKKDTRLIMISCCAAAATGLILKNVAEVRLPWHMDTAFLLAPYAGLGVLYRKGSASRRASAPGPGKTGLLILGLSVIHLASCAVNAMNASGHIDYNLMRTNGILTCYLAGIAGVFAVVLILERLPDIRWLAFVGRNSAVYYCLSFIGSRLVIRGLWPAANIALAMFALWAVPVPIVMIINRWFPWLTGNPRHRDD